MPISTANLHKKAKDPMTSTLIQGLKRKLLAKPSMALQICYWGSGSYDKAISIHSKGDGKKTSK
jgi:hypothetical protein